MSRSPGPSPSAARAPSGASAAAPRTSGRALDPPVAQPLVERAPRLRERAAALERGRRGSAFVQ